VRYSAILQEKIFLDIKNVRRYKWSTYVDVSSFLFFLAGRGEGENPNYKPQGSKGGIKNSKQKGKNGKEERADTNPTESI
jgi:hypothetical protein